MLACVQSVDRNLGVNLRRGEVDDDFNIRIREQLFVRDVRDAVEFMLLRGTLRDDIRARDDFEIAEFLRRLEIGVGNHAASDDTDFRCFHEGKIL